jgi:chromosome segregation ATPase
MARNKRAQGDSDKQTIEILTQRYQDLNERKIKAQTNLENAERQLRELKKKAMETYGTDDVEELKRQLERLKAENESRRASYEELLNKIETDLAEVEAKHSSVEDLEGNP